MASWKRHISLPKPIKASTNVVSSASNIGFNNYSSGLRDVYTGPVNRMERYNQYDLLDRDPVVSSALNIIAESCVDNNDVTGLPFNIIHADLEEPTTPKIISSSMKKWMYVNSFQKRLFHIIRNTLKYGDTFFIRDPETYEWHYIDPRNVEKIVVDDNAGREPYSYFIHNVSLNLTNKIFTQDTPMTTMSQGTSMTATSPSVSSTSVNIGGGITSSNMGATGGVEIPAKHIIHLSLNSTGLDFVNWPFAASILETIYKPAKQKELLENAFLIYAIQRAPERRVFYVYTGDEPSHKAMMHVERFKNELQQKRIPSRNGGQNSVVDSTYDPQCLDLKTKIKLIDGRQLNILELADEYEDGIENYTYSVDPETNQILPGKISWAGITRKNAEVMKLWFSNGTDIILTPDHQIPVQGKGYVMAQDLEIGDKFYGENVTLVRKSHLDITMDTGCITVDKDELIHSHHNFMIAQGIFVKNSILNDFYLPVNAEGQGPRIETLPGSDNLASGMDNLKYFNDMITRGLNIPSSYIPTTGEDSALPYNDGKLGMALLQEYRFSKSCQRIQNLFREEFDFEFKLFCKKIGVVADASDFHLEFIEPQSFSDYRQIEKDSAALSNMGSAMSFPHFSKRFIMERFGNLSPEDIARNEELWKTENKNQLKDSVADIDINEIDEIGLNSVGIKKPTNDDEESPNDTE